MKSAIDIAKISARGTATLTLGLIISNVTLAIGTFIVGGILNTEEYGLYAIVLTVPALFSIFQDLGVNSALIKFTAQYRTENNKGEIKKILATGLAFDALIGTCLSLASYFLAGFLAVNVSGRPEIKGLIEIVSVTILFSSMASAAQSIFVGFERMEFNSATSILHAVLKSVISPIFVLIGYSVLGAILGVIVSGLATTVLGIAVALLFFYRKIEVKSTNFVHDFKSALVLMISYGLPVSASNILAGFLPQFYNFLVYRVELSNTLIANYQMATNFTVLMSFLTIPIVTVLFPAFSKLRSDQDSQVLKSVFQISVKYGSLVVVPAALGLMVLSRPLVGTLFAEKFAVAPFYLMLLATSGLYSGLGNMSIYGIINSQGETKITLKLTLLTFVMGISLGVVLITWFGILGLITTTLVAGLPSLFVGSWWIKRHFDVSVKWASAKKIYGSSAVASFSTYVITANLALLPYWNVLVIGGMCFISIYLVAISITRALEDNDIWNLREMFKDIGPISKFVNPILTLISKISAIRKSSK